MRSAPPPELEISRRRHPLFGNSPASAMYGYFAIQLDGILLHVISSGSQKGDRPQDQWEHVSVSAADRCPTWAEMDYVKSLFWGDHETVLQFHPKLSQKVNIAQTCLHLWKRRGRNHELPPTELV